jgi:hypothetical protein
MLQKLGDLVVAWAPVQRVVWLQEQPVKEAQAAKVLQIQTQEPAAAEPEQLEPMV